MKSEITDWHRWSHRVPLLTLSHSYQYLWSCWHAENSRSFQFTLEHCVTRNCWCFLTLLKRLWLLIFFLDRKRHFDHMCGKSHWHSCMTKIKTWRHKLTSNLCSLTKYSIITLVNYLNEQFYINLNTHHCQSHLMCSCFSSATHVVINGKMATSYFSSHENILRLPSPNFTKLKTLQKRWWESGDALFSLWIKQTHTVILWI